MELFLLFAFTALINCAYFIFFSKFAFYHSSEKDRSSFPVSLIVCAKNEAKNLENHIPLWITQNHPEFEIILINDGSMDDSLEIMERFSVMDSRIKVVNVVNNETFWGNKKYALTLGIKRARYEHMIFTDADCRPSSNSWLSLMTSEFSNKKQLVLGYGAYEKTKGFLNKIIRFETLMTAVQYFSYAKAGIPYMGVGRNLGYTASLYYNNRGFINHIKIASGDDDLFVNETATAKNTAICINPDAFTYSIPKKSFKEWIKQKRRHFTTSKYYKSKHKLLLGFYSFSTLLYWVLLPFVFIYGNPMYAICVVCLRFLIQYIIIGKIAKKLQETSLIPLIPLWEMFLIFIQIGIFISKRNQNTLAWK